MTKEQASYMLVLLEEIRLLQSSQLMVLARFRDDYKGYTDSRTYKVAEEEVSESVERLQQYYQSNEKNCAQLTHNLTKK